MASFLEIYQILRQVTLTKAKILEEVIDHKYCAQLKQSYIDKTDNIQNEHTRTQIDNIKSLAINIDYQSQEKMLSQFNVLKTQQNDIKNLKNARVDQRMDIITKRKQLQVILQQQKYQEELEPYLPNQKIVSEFKWTCIDKEDYEKACADYLKISQQVISKQEQNMFLQQQIETQTYMVQEVYGDYQQLQDDILKQQQRITTLKRQLQEKQFQYERALIQNGKLKNELLSFENKKQNIRGLEQKINKMQRAYEKIKAKYESSLTNTQGYLQKIAELESVLGL